MRSDVLVVTVLLSTLFLGVAPRDAGAHGGVPVSQQILWQGETLVVPATYWGLFIGPVGGDWQWICEEAITGTQPRLFALVSDGTLYSSDRTGVRFSRDGGCTWSSTASGSGIDSLIVAALLADPVLPRIWVLANNQDGSGNGLWYSDDDATTWKRAYATTDAVPNGLLLSADGQAIYISAATTATPAQAVLYVSSDGGMSFTEQALSFQIDGQPLSYFLPLWLDPQVAHRVYLSVENDSGSVLLQMDGTAAPVQVLSTPALLYSMARAPAGDLVLVGTSNGLFAAQGGGAFMPLATLSSAQCLSVHDATLYACASSYSPDLAAVATLSGDVSSYKKVFQFSDTKGPISCPAGTPVAQICPSYWASYASQLGVSSALPVPGMQTPQPTQGNGCSLLPQPAAPLRSLYAALLLFLIGLRRLRFSRAGARA